MMWPFSIFQRLAALEQWRKDMTTALDNLVADEAALESVVTAVVADNTTIHQELTAALAANDTTAIQAVADKIAAQTANLSALVPAPAPAAPTA